jgi:hypothetical protein
VADKPLDSVALFGGADRDAGLEVTQISRIREHARGRIAFWIVGSLITIVVLSYAVFTLLIFRNPGVSFAELKDLTEILVAPVIGIVGAVTGFYFGEKQAGRGSGDEQ